MGGNPSLTAAQLRVGADPGVLGLRTGLCVFRCVSALRGSAIATRCAFTSSNCEVFMMYESRGGKILAISVWLFLMRLVINGCVENSPSHLPRFFSPALARSRNEMNAWGSYPAAYKYSKPR